MIGTTVYYNGVLFRDAEIHDYEQVIEYDDSGTQEKYSRVQLTFSSTLVSIVKIPSSGSGTIADNPNHLSTIGIAGTIAGQTMVDRFEEIQMRFQEPRKDFWLAFNDCLRHADSNPPAKEDPDVPWADPDPQARKSFRLALVATGIRGTHQDPEYPEDPNLNEFLKLFDEDLDVKREDVFDCNAGPKPKSIKVSKFIGGYSARIIATIEVCRNLCKPNANQNDPEYDSQLAQGVIANRWSVTDSLDNEGRVTHNVKGKITLKDHRYKANAMRTFCFVLAFPYARLVSRNYVVDTTGLVLEYNLSFQHAGSAPPFGIRDYKATYTEGQSIGGDKGFLYGSMSIRVKGYYHRSNINANFATKEAEEKLILLRGATTILWSRIGSLVKAWNPVPGKLIDGQDGNLTLLQSLAVSEQVGVPELELSAHVRYNRPEHNEMHLRLQQLGAPIDVTSYDPRWWPMDSVFGRDMIEDEHNPYFQAANLPHATEGDPQKSDYFWTGYFSSPGRRLHTTPRITGETINDPETTDLGKEWAEPGGFMPEDGGDADIHNATLLSKNNPVPRPGSSNFSAQKSRNLKGNEISISASLEDYDPGEFSGLADVQRTDFAYLQWSSQVFNDSDEGVLHLPLSAPRVREVTLPEEVYGEGDPVNIRETSTFVRLFSGMSRRVYSVTARRVGKWPEIPEPKQVIYRIPPGYAGQSEEQYAKPIIEQLLKKEVGTPIPVLGKDGVTREFEVHARYTYGLSRPWGATAKQGGGDALLGDTLPLPTGKSPIDLATASHNEIPFRVNVPNPAPPGGYDPDQKFSGLFNDSAQYG